MRVESRCVRRSAGTGAVAQSLYAPFPLRRKTLVARRLTQRSRLRKLGEQTVPITATYVRDRLQ
jgi:hypothetical protein